MSRVTSAQAIAARFVVCACAIVCGCSKPEPDDARTSPSVAASGRETSAVDGTSELQDWAKHATAGVAATDDVGQPAPARSASAALATPVIHTVD